ncbi:MAG: ABC transporter ATP-binding protein [Planctomycetes bacterium]|nr:ABC transporter ATP-binding protein [Planctomycetota bacterium]
MIVTRNLLKEYDNIIAVDHLNLDVAAGECFGFIGPNGAGKTTTIRMLAHLLEPTGGEIFIDGRDLSEKPGEVHGLIGYMSDTPALYDGLLVREFYEYYCSAYRVDPAARRQRVGDTIDLMNLAAKAEVPVRTLSRGMRQRLMLGKTLLHDPRVLLLDEPASGLDPVARMDFRDVMVALSKQGKTIIVSSHILTELSEFCTSVGIMERGRMVLSGRVDDVLADTKDSAVITIRCLAGAREVCDYVSAQPKVTDAVCEGDTVTINYEGGLEEIAALHTDLATRGFKMLSFAEKKENLEDIFMRAQHFEVS